jgi:hypothetical protein
MTKKIFTVSEVIEKIQDEMDLQEETFINQNEYISYINEALDDTEREIMSLYEGYFNTSATISLVSGTKAYSLPNNIYAAKLKHVQYKRSEIDYYKINRITLKEIAGWETLINTNMQDFKFDIQYDSSAVGQQIVFYPTPNETVSDVVRLWYIRQCERVSALSDLVDAPDAHQFIFAFLKHKVAIKELSPLLGTYKQELEEQRQKLRASFTDMIPDETEELERDMSFYRDFDNDTNRGGFW